MAAFFLHSKRRNFEDFYFSAVQPLSYHSFQ